MSDIDTKPLAPLMTVGELLSLLQKYNPAELTDLKIVGTANKIEFADQKTCKVDLLTFSESGSICRSIIVLTAQTMPTKSNTFGYLISMLQRCQQEAKVIFQAFDRVTSEKEYFHMPKELEQCLYMFSTPGLFKETLICEMTTEKYLVETLTKLQCDFAAAVRFTTQISHRLRSDLVRVWYVEGKWVTSRQLSKTYPWLATINREKLFISACDGILQCWNSLIPFEKAKDKLLSSSNNNSDNKKSTQSEDPVALILAKYEQPQPANCSDSILHLSNEHVDRIPPAETVVKGLQLADFVSHLANLYKTGQGNMSLSVSKKVIYWSTSFYEETRGVDQFDLTSIESGLWTSIVLSHALAIGNRVSVQELYQKLEPLATKKPWAMVSIVSGGGSPLLTEICKPALYSVKRDQQWIPVCRSSDNPFCHRGGSIWESYTNGAGALDAKHFASNFPSFQCWVLENVFYSAEQMDKQFPGIEKYNSRLFTRVLPGSPTFVFKIPRMTVKDLHEAYPLPPLTPVEELLQQYVPKE